jgi:hypothetical protein
MPLSKTLGAKSGCEGSLLMFLLLLWLLFLNVVGNWQLASYMMLLNVVVQWCRYRSLINYVATICVVVKRCCYMLLCKETVV